MTTCEPRVLLIGDGPTTASALEAVLAEFELVAIVRSGDASDPVVARALAAGAEVLCDGSLRAVMDAVERFAPDLVLVSSYARILPPELVNRVPFVNVHYAPLPAYRGRATVNWALINGEDSVSISIHSIVPGLDAGPILYRGDVSIRARSTASELYEELNSLQREHLGAAIRRRLSGDLGDPQADTGASYACSRNPSDGVIDWGATTAEIDRLIRALTPPFPSAFTVYQRRRLAILDAQPVLDAAHYVGRVPGRVVFIDKQSGTVDVLTGDGVLRLGEVERDGEVLRAAGVIRSVRDTLGLQLGELTAWFLNEQRMVSSYAEGVVA